MIQGRRIITCVICRELQPHKNRGLCQNCYRSAKRDGSLHEYAVRKVRLEDHIAAIDKREPEACWPWPGRIKESGYGYARHGQAHRAVWEELVGPIPNGLTLDHLCHTRDSSCLGGVNCHHRRCVNPRHLGLVDGRTNTMLSRNAPASINARKTHCIHGHEFTVANTRVNPDGSRSCRACIRYFEHKRSGRG